MCECQPDRKCQPCRDWEVESRQLETARLLRELDEAREEIKEQRKEILDLRNDLCKAEAYYRYLRGLAAEVRPDLKVRPVREIL